jgi:hypothetical protein
MEYLQCFDAPGNSNYFTYCFLAKAGEGSQGYVKPFDVGLPRGWFLIAGPGISKEKIGAREQRVRPKPEKGGDYSAACYISDQNHP